MKNIRLGNDISIKWYVYRMNSPEDFNGKTVEVHLLDKNDVKQNFTYKIEDGLIDGVFYGKNQITTGSYRLVLVENAGNNNMVTLDYVDAFVLNSKMHNTTSSGSDTVCNMKTQIVNLTSIMSSKTGAINMYDYYTKDEVDEILNGYAPLEHTHDQYALASDLSSYALKSELPDTSNFATKDELPSEYDDTQVRNLIGTKQDKLNEQQIANLNADHSKYLTEHQTLPDYSSTYAPLEHTHSQYLTQHQTLPDYSSTYAPIEHTHAEYALKTELFSKDYNDLTNKPTIPEEYDDTQVRNLIGTKQDKLTQSQIANLNADHSKYLTQHQTLPDYSNTYAHVNHTHNQYADKQHTHAEYLKSESDPTVPAYVKSIKQTDIDAWNAATGGIDLSDYVTKTDLDAASYITASQVTHPDYSNTYAGISHTHSQYLTEHQTLPDYSSTYAQLEHSHSQYLESESDPTVPAYVKSIKQTDIDAWNAATGGIDLSDYVTKTDLNTASYITTSQVTHPDYSNTYAGIAHTHSQYAAVEHTHSQYAYKDHTHSNYALKTELPDTSNFATKDELPSEYDDTAVRNLIGTKQDKLTTQQIANLNADHSKYLTKHQTLPNYSTTYAPLEHSHSQYLKSESDPTVPAYVKSIKQTDIDAWNAATGGIDLSEYVTKADLGAASYITASQVTHPDYSTTYAKLEHSHNQYLTQHQTLPDYSNTYAGISHTHSQYAALEHSHNQYAYKDHTHSNYALKTELFSKDYNDLTNKPTIPEEYDDTQVRNLIDTKQDKLTESQIANLNADHSKYLTQHQTLPDYSSTYAPVNHTHSQYLTQHQTLPDYSNTYAPLEHTHDQYAGKNHIHTDYADKGHTHPYYAAKEHSHSNYAEKSHTHSQYATISYLNEKLGSIDAALTNILEG